MLEPGPYEGILTLRVPSSNAETCVHMTFEWHVSEATTTKRLLEDILARCKETESSWINGFANPLPSDFDIACAFVLCFVCDSLPEGASYKPGGWSFNIVYTVTQKLS